MTSPEFQSHLAGTVTTLCYCWRLTLRDGTVFGFTDHDRAIEADGTEFAPQTGFSASEARRSEGLGIDTTDVEGMLSSDRITEQDILDGRYDGAAVETLIVNWREPGEFAALSRATIGKITRADGKFVAELESFGRGLDLASGRQVRRSCDAQLGDVRCGVSLAAFTATGEVVSFDGHDSMVVAGLDAYAAGWFANGVLTWTSGGMEGRSERVVDFRHDAAGTTIVIWPSLSTLPEPGDAFSLVAGCDKSFATCKAKFGNALNFRGFPHLPGNDSAYSYVTADGAFDGGPLVP
jgi:uncharacterized phage protein (TIGR02218 family)